MRISYRAIGRNIRRARLARGFTQAQTAEFLHMSTLHFGRLERGQRRASLDQLAQISDLLDGSLETLRLGAITANDPLQPLDSSSAAFAFLAAGCSDSAVRLMLHLCQSIAAQDKFPTK